MIIKIGKELRVFCKINGFLFSIIRYEVYEVRLGDVYPVNPCNYQLNISLQSVEMRILTLNPVLKSIKMIQTR